MSEYQPKAKTSMIHFISRASVKVQDNFYTVEYGEERQVGDDVNIIAERKALIDDCNEQVDQQVADIVKTFLK